MDELLKLIKNISVYTLGNLLNKALGFILIPIYSVYLSTEDYGIISAMTIFISFCAVICSLSLDRAIYRCYFDYKTEEQKKTFLGTIIIALFFFTTIFAFTIILLSDYVGLIFNSIPFYPYYFLALLILCISTAYQIVLIYYRVTEQSKKYVLFSLGYLIINSSLIIYFVTNMNTGALGKLNANVIANLIFLPIAFLAIRNKINFKVDIKMLKDSLKYSIPIIPNLLSGLLLSMSDRIFIEKIINLHSMGIYSLGSQLAGGLAFVGAAFYGAFFPLFFRIANLEKEKIHYLKIIQDNYHLIMIVLHFLAFFFAKEIFLLIIDPKFIESYKIFQLIIIASLYNSIFDVLNLSFSQDKKTATLMYIVVFGVVLNITLNYFLVPIMGIYGACYATIISFIFIGTIKYFFARNYFFINWNWKDINLIMIIICFIYALSLLLNFEVIIYNFIIKIALSSSILFFITLKIKKSVNIFQK
tara:strand:+ start:2681 stop:4099 length:1419 start_codon:yes stop_codon:yes gene_type:complete